MRHKCSHCDSTFSKMTNLRKHARRFHKDNVSEIAPIRRGTSTEASFYCDLCDKKFIHRESLRRHSKTHNVDRSSTNDVNPDSHEQNVLKNSRYSKKCPLCEYNGTYKKDMLEHFDKVHEIECVTSNLTFDSIEEFNKWKMEMESTSNCRFIKKGTQSFKSRIRSQYICHRSGNYVPEGKGERRIKIQGSNKINAFCPANIQLLIENDKNIKVQYLETHIGHVNDIGFLQLTPLERENLALKIAAKVPFDDILDGVRDSINNSSLKRTHLLTKKDLFNIESSFNLNNSSVRHSIDVISVESWVIEMQTSGDCIIFYKPQGIVLEEQPLLKEEDFLLIIMTPAQCELLRKHGSDCICVDATHGLNKNDFKLHTLFIIDDIREGFPCAFFVSNRCDMDIIKFFFTQIKINAGLISPSIFMSDLAESYFNAWLQVMGVPGKRLFCTWHIDRAWWKNLPKIKTKEKHVMIYKMLKTLLQETNPMDFEIMLEQFCNNMSDPDTTDFMIYFKENYQRNCKHWAYCYRLHSELKTNKHLELMHRTIKDIYLGGIAALMRYTREKLIDKLLIINKGNLSNKLKHIRNRHTDLKEINSFLISRREHGWELTSYPCSEIYFIQEVKDSCMCQLICLQCGICLHRYCCTCLDSAKKFNMCQHIHLLAQYRKETEDSENASTTDDVKEIEEEQWDCNWKKEIDDSKVIFCHLSKKQKTISIEDRKKQIMAKFQDILYGTTSSESLDIIENTVESLTQHDSYSF